MSRVISSVQQPTETLSLASQLTHMESHQSVLETALRQDPVYAVSVFDQKGLVPVDFQPVDDALSPSSCDEVGASFPKLLAAQSGHVLEAVSGATGVSGRRIAVLFSGGPASGGHNVLLGIKHILGKKNTLFGIESGPKGLLKGAFFELTDTHVNEVKNLGGFDCLGSDRTKIKTDGQFRMVKDVLKKHRMDGLIIIGGDDSNTNAAVLAEYLMDEGITVVGVPKTIDGDLQAGRLLPISFGFDTATKIYAEMVGNILQDTPSSRKYWHFIKLMGRSASQVTLEVALQTRPAKALISEEVLGLNQSLDEIVTDIANAVLNRAIEGINHGVVLVPEGLIEFIPEIKALLDALNRLYSTIESDLGRYAGSDKIDWVSSQLPSNLQCLFKSLPLSFAETLLLDRDSHGNVQVSLIDTEALLAEMVADKVAEMQDDVGLYFRDRWFSDDELARLEAYSYDYHTHFFGYEGRCGAPSRFDQGFSYNLGLTAGSLVLRDKTGYMASVTDFDQGGRILALPLSAFIVPQERDGKTSLVIEKALVDLTSPAYRYFCDRRDDWVEADVFMSPGPRQFWGKMADQIPFTVALNQDYDSVSYHIGHVKMEA